MNKQIEIEYKILLTKDMFETILQTYQHNITNDYIQTNHYLTHPTLQDKHYMLRVREKEGTYEFTLKKPYLNHRLEYNVMLSKEDKDKLFQHQPIDNDIISILKEDIDPLTLQQQFSLQTHRYDIELPEGILSLDHNTYLNQEDYELEFEVYDETKGYQKFLEIITPFQLQYENNCPSKVVRALNAYKNKAR